MNERKKGVNSSSARENKRPFPKSGRSPSYKDFSRPNEKNTASRRNHPLQESTQKTYSSSYHDYEYSSHTETGPAENSLPEESYILTGRNPIREALKNNRDLEKLLVQKGELSGSAMEIVKTAKDRKIPVQIVEKSRLDEITPRHQGLIAFASAFSYSSVDDILQAAADAILGSDAADQMDIGGAFGFRLSHHFFYRHHGNCPPPLSLLR